MQFRDLCGMPPRMARGPTVWAGARVAIHAIMIANIRHGITMTRITKSKLLSGMHCDYCHSMSELAAHRK